MHHVPGWQHSQRYVFVAKPVAYSQDLDAGWAQGVWERKSLSGFRGQSPMEGLGKILRIIHTQCTVCSWQTHSTPSVYPTFSPQAPASPSPKKLRISTNPKTHCSRDKMGICLAYPSKPVFGFFSGAGVVSKTQYESFGSRHMIIDRCVTCAR